MKKVILSSFIIPMVLTSCGVKSVDDDAKAPFFTEELAEIFKQDVSCVNTHVLIKDENDTVNVTQLMGGELAQRTFSLDKLFEENYVLNKDVKSVSAIKYGGRVKTTKEAVYNYELKEYLFYSGSYPKRVEEQKEMTFCPTQTDYQRYSYEAAAISYSNAIDTTFKKIKDVDPNLNIGSIELVVLPVQEIEYSYLGGPSSGTKSKSYKADNASYSPWDKVITVYPQALSNQKEEQPGYWEVPLIAGHEYGHHIFSEILGSNLISNAKDKDVHEHKHDHDTCFFNKENFDRLEAQINSRLSDRRDNTAKFALDAMNEGIADLIGIYTGDKDFDTYKGLNCFYKTRDVKSSKSYYFGDEKVFNVENVKTMDNSDHVPMKIVDCDKINYQRIHSVGAVFAHHMNNIFAKNISNKKWAKKEKLSYLLKWMKLLCKESKNFDDGLASDYLFHSIELAHKVVLDENGAKGSEYNCSLMNDAFEGVNKICKYLIPKVEETPTPELSSI